MTLHAVPPTPEVEDTPLESMVPSSGAASPKVSIGLPVWNGEDFVQDALDSLLAQWFEDFELIIADNDSTDRTEAICREYASHDKRIRYCRNDHNIGLQANTQLVLDLATAPYFMWACHDDLWDRSYLAKLVDQLDHSDSLVLAGSNAASIDGTDTVRQLYDNRSYFPQSSTYVRARRLISAHPQGGHSLIILGVLRTQVAKSMRLASFDTIRLHNTGKYAWDKRALFRLLFEGDFYVSAETLYFHRDASARWRSRIEPARGTVPVQLQRAVLHSLDLHGYFNFLRSTVLASRLSAGQKVSLVAVSLVQEVRYLAAYYWSHIPR